MQTDNIERQDAGSDARLADWNGENHVYEPNGSFVAKMFDDGHEEIAPEDSISMKDVRRESYGKLSLTLVTFTFHDEIWGPANSLLLN